MKHTILFTNDKITSLNNFYKYLSKQKYCNECPFTDVCFEYITDNYNLCDVINELIKKYNKKKETRKD